MTSAPRRVRKAIIPAAGLGTRFLPASKVVPKEMLPVLDKPVIQFIVEGAAASGIEEIVIVTAAAKRSIQDHFERNPQLEGWLEQVGKFDALEQLRRLTSLARLVYVYQPVPLGNGHAVLMARQAIGDEPFVMLWGDDFVMGEPPIARQLIDAYQRTGNSVVAVMAVAAEDVDRYGMVEVAEKLDARTMRVAGIVEKPLPGQAPSRFGAVAGYLLTPDVFEHLERAPVGRAGEIWLSDAVQKLAEDGGLVGLELAGRRYDVGHPLGLLEASVDRALADPNLGPMFRAMLRARLGT